MDRRSCHARPLALSTLLFLGSAAASGAAAPSDPASPIPPGFLDYSEPALLTGTVYEQAPEPKKVLFTFRRTATRSNATVQALIEFRTPDGTPAARERMVYEAGRLVSFRSEQLQAGSEGRVVLSTESGPPRLLFEFTPGPGARKKTDRETLQKETLVNDMIAPFIQAHWDRLSQGAAVKFRYVAVERAETVGFKLVREAETTWRNQPVLRLKMEPTSLVIAALVEPLCFTVEKATPHRVLQYVGRITPKLDQGGKWKDLDATTIYDWK